MQLYDNLLTIPDICGIIDIVIKYISYLITSYKIQ